MVPTLETSTERRSVIYPFGTLELVAEPGREVDVDQVGPDVTGWRVDVDLDGYTWPVRVDWGPLGGMDGGTAPAFEPGDLPGRPAGAGENSSPAV